MTMDIDTAPRNAGEHDRMLNENPDWVSRVEGMKDSAQASGDPPQHRFGGTKPVTASVPVIFALPPSKAH
jgi:hypothetical protein